MNAKHRAKLAEAEAKANELRDADQLSDASVWDLAKAFAAKAKDKLSDIKEEVVSNDPKVRKEQEFIRKIDSQNLRSESEALGTVAGQYLRKVGDVGYGVVKGLVRGTATGGSGPKKEDPPQNS